MTPERLQKILARTGIGSRRQIEEMIREGRITIDGRVAGLGDRADLDSESVKVDGRRIAAPTKPRHYLLLNKPAGVMSTRHDPEGRPTVMDLLPPRLRKALVPVGRLDFATEGLLLLTDDGDLAHHVAHPRYGCRKTYEVKVKGHPAEAALDKLRQGIVLDGKRTAPVDIRARGKHLGHRDSVENSWWVVVLGEGRTRQIREMFLRIGHPVARLRRVAIGPLSDPHLKRGAWRELTESEVESLRSKTARRRRRPTPPKAAKTKPAAAKTKPAAAKTKPARAKIKPAAAKTKPAAAKTKPAATKRTAVTRKSAAKGTKPAGRAKPGPRSPKAGPGRPSRKASGPGTGRKASGPGTGRTPGRRPAKPRSGSPKTPRRRS